MVDLESEKVQAFTTNNCFGRSRLMKLYNTHTMNEIKKIHVKNVTLKYLGRSKDLKFNKPEKQI